MKNLMIACALALTLTLVPAAAFAGALPTAPVQDAATNQEVAPCPHGYENCPLRDSGTPCPQVHGSCGGCRAGAHGVACPLAWGQNLAGATLERLAPLYALMQSAQATPQESTAADEASPAASDDEAFVCPLDGTSCPRHGGACPNAACPADGVDCPRHGDACPNAACPLDGIDCPRHGGACPNLSDTDGGTARDGSSTWNCPSNGHHGSGHGCGRGCR